MGYPAWNLLPMNRLITLALPRRGLLSRYSIYKSWPCNSSARNSHDDVIKWKHFLCYWPFVRGIHRSPVNSTHNDQWRGALIISLICAWTNGWVNNREAGDLIRHGAHYDVIVMQMSCSVLTTWQATRIVDPLMATCPVTHKWRRPGNGGR